MVWIWLLLVASCMLASGPLEKRGSTGMGLLAVFFGLFVLGVGLITIGAYLLMLASVSKNHLQLVINVVPIAIGAFIVWMVAKPLMKLIVPLLRRK